MRCTPTVTVYTSMCALLGSPNSKCPLVARVAASHTKLKV